MRVGVTRRGKTAELVLQRYAQASDGAPLAPHALARWQAVQPSAIKLLSYLLFRAPPAVRARPWWDAVARGWRMTESARALWGGHGLASSSGPRAWMAGALAAAYEELRQQRCSGEAVAPGARAVPAARSACPAATPGHGLPPPQPCPACLAASAHACLPAPPASPPQTAP